MNKRTQELSAWAAKQLEGTIKHLEKALENGRNNYDVIANSELLRAEKKAENTVVVLRNLPFCSGADNPETKVRMNIFDAFPCKLGYTEEGWFCLRMPLLLPKKEGGNTWYIRGSLLPYLESFFRSRIPHKYSDCVIVFHHIYDENRTENRWRDHDNIETKTVTDLLGLYLMPDDNPLICDHYYCSSRGKSDSTEVYIIPRGDFVRFLGRIKSGYMDSAELFKEYTKKR